MNEKLRRVKDFEKLNDLSKLKTFSKEEIESRIQQFKNMLKKSHMSKKLRHALKHREILAGSNCVRHDEEKIQHDRHYNIIAYEAGKTRFCPHLQYDEIAYPGIPETAEDECSLFNVYLEREKGDDIKKFQKCYCLSSGGFIKGNISILQKQLRKIKKIKNDPQT